MALTLRTEVDARFTTKGAELSHSELDTNFIEIHDLIDDNAAALVTISADVHAANEDLKLDEGGGNEVSAAELRALLDGDIINEIQATDVDANWNGTAGIISVDTDTAAVTITFLTADLAAGKIVTVKDNSGNADGNPITLFREGGEALDGSAADYVISTSYGYKTFFINATPALFTTGEA